MGYWWVFAMIAFGLVCIATASMALIGLARVDVKGWKWAVTSIICFIGLVWVLLSH